MEDPSNRNRLAKLLRFFSSNDAEKQTTLLQYVERMKDKQQAIYYVAGTSRPVNNKINSFLKLKTVKFGDKQNLNFFFLILNSTFKFLNISIGKKAFEIVFLIAYK